jgi:hypothetical protein
MELHANEISGSDIHGVRNGAGYHWLMSVNFKYAHYLAMLRA